MPMFIIPYKDEYRTCVQEICIATASERARTDCSHREFTLWMYCDPYLDGGRAYLLMDDAGLPAGYVLCAESFEKYCSFIRPYEERIRSLGPLYAERMESERKEYEQYSVRYPSHLHIDLLEGVTGQGYGSLLLQKLIADLKMEGGRGIMLGVSSSRPGAIRFYKKNGFHVIASDPSGCTMGINLEELK